MNLLTSIFTYLVDSNKDIYIFRAMDAVRYYSAEQLGDMTKHDISHLVGDKEGRKLYTQLTIEKSGDCWHVRNIYSFFKMRLNRCNALLFWHRFSYWTSRKDSLELIELSSINKVSLVKVSSCSNTGSIRDDPYWTSRKDSLELIELSSINKVSLV